MPEAQQVVNFPLPPTIKVRMQGVGTVTPPKVENDPKEEDE